MEVTSKSRSQLKAYFVKNAIPTESNFVDLIDGMVNPKDDGIVKKQGVSKIVALEGTNVSSFPGMPMFPSNGGPSGPGSGGGSKKN